ncbi:WhiB family transcriptional regulator [Streptomyces sp. NPDC056437]|uniref:WhiB family transcriptional regulator n=1 Tax=Streptomyces sp. NPDC056437 TaxID=3345816 RepID=UPI0036CC77BC
MTTTTRRARTLAAPPARHDDWRSDALCVEVGAESFFPEGKGEAVRQQVEAAQRVCAACPVRRECGEWALATKQTHGVWGGMSEQQRKYRRSAAGRARSAGQAAASTQAVSA